MEDDSLLLLVVPAFAVLLLGVHFLFDLSWWQSVFLGFVGAIAFGCAILLGVQLEDIRRRLPQ